MWKTKLGVCCIVHVILGVVSSHTTECEFDRWLLAPTAIVGLVEIIVSTSQSDRLIRVPVDRLYRWNHGSCYVGLPEELEDFRLLLDQRSKVEVCYLFFQTYINYAMISLKNRVIGSVRDGENARIGLVVTAIRVEAMDSIATARHERAAQGGHAGEE
ncbi:hypothetical protein Gohar_025215 [Gossypium harknessii]|uniref:Secreted protein n=1 Tax=Gossypium harknessii TaxID=34285 RepID=A0A7J9HIB8_9ROSI|nr:hypothetical protein [Gossypium harknessii]